MAINLFNLCDLQKNHIKTFKLQFINLTKILLHVLMKT